MAAKLTLVVIGDLFDFYSCRVTPLVIHVVFQAFRYGFHYDARGFAATFGAGADIFVHELKPYSGDSNTDKDNEYNWGTYQENWVENFEKVHRFHRGKKTGK
ncbi:MAG: hypothetical protein KKD28_05435 [Chloroflexi bacterium]|nr:hypothetical protein [Chloroflexota bacterium]MBU1660898.1 hypothetical protein [Chloroflexota bacterium]